MPICIKVISSWVREVLSIAKACMSMGSLQGTVALMAGSSLVSTLQAGNCLLRVESIFQLLSPLHLGTWIQFNVLSWALKSR